MARAPRTKNLSRTARVTIEPLEQRVLLATAEYWLLPGDEAPDFTLPDLVSPFEADDAYTLSDDPASTIILNFSDRNSADGAQTIAQLQELQDWIDDNGIDAHVVIVEVNQWTPNPFWDDWVEDVQQFKDAHGYTMDVVLDDVYLYVDNSGRLRRYRDPLFDDFGDPTDDEPIWFEYGALDPTTTFVINQQGGIQVIEATHVGWDPDLVQTLQDEAEHWSQWAVLPSVSISDATITETDAGSSRLNFTVTLSAPTADPVVLSYQTQEAQEALIQQILPTIEEEADYIAADGRDYRTKAKELIFSPGQTTKTIGITVRGDTDYERAEFFCVRLTDISANARFSDRLGLGTITDNEKRPRISINDVQIKEGQTGRRKAAFTISLSGASYKHITIHYTTEDFTAVDREDYLYESASVKFQKGETTKRVSVWVLGDRLRERTEAFVVNLHDPTHATLGDARGVARIVDNDRYRASATLAFRASSPIRSFSDKPISHDDVSSWLDELLVVPR